MPSPRYNTKKTPMGNSAATLPFFILLVPFTQKTILLLHIIADVSPLCKRKIIFLLEGGSFTNNTIPIGNEKASLPIGKGFIRPSYFSSSTFKIFFKRSSVVGLASLSKRAFSAAASAAAFSASAFSWK